MKFHLDVRQLVGTVLTLFAVFLPALVVSLAVASDASLAEFLGTVPNVYVAFALPTAVGGAAYLLLLGLRGASGRHAFGRATILLPGALGLGWILLGMEKLLADARFSSALFVGVVVFGVVASAIGLVNPRSSGQ